VFNQVVIVDDLPVVEMKRFDKLAMVTKKIFSAHGEVKDINIPSSDGKTLGFAFIEYATAAGAETAVKKGDRHRLDKSHTLRVNFYQDYEKMLNVSYAARAHTHTHTHTHSHPFTRTHSSSIATSCVLSMLYVCVSVACAMLAWSLV
jgi:hypothetical protein